MVLVAFVEFVFAISNLFGGDLGKGRGNLEISGWVIGIGAVDLN